MKEAKRFSPKRVIINLTGIIPDEEINDLIDIVKGNYLSSLHGSHDGGDSLLLMSLPEHDFRHPFGNSFDSFESGTLKGLKANSYKYKGDSFYVLNGLIFNDRAVLVGKVDESEVIKKAKLVTQ